MSDYKDKKVAVVGMSVEGQDSALFFAQVGAIVTRLDKRMGPDYLKSLEKFDLVVRTPGMNLRTPEFQTLRNKLTSLTKIFFDECPAPIIGVTGTKGKGTTSTLIYEMLKTVRSSVWLGGNVGTPLLSKVRDIKPDDIVVLELSSFQLEDLTKSPFIAVVLKVTQEHLFNFDPLASSYHVSREAYVDAKKSIVKYQKKSDSVIFNADDPTSTSFKELSKASPLSFSRLRTDADAYVKDHRVFLNKEEICFSGEIQLLGDHNLENIAAASLVAARMGVPVASIQKVARTFKGLEHRLEFVGSYNGVTYYNDSFSTVPETTTAAIQSFSKPIILIVGGSEKGSDYRELGNVILNSQVKTLIVIGAMTQRILNAVSGYSGQIITGLTSMHDIVEKAQKAAEPGDIVLLSPACASFDMFKNYKERGELFTYEVSQISGKS